MILPLGENERNGSAQNQSVNLQANDSKANDSDLNNAERSSSSNQSNDNTNEPGPSGINNKANDQSGLNAADSKDDAKSSSSSSSSSANESASSSSSSSSNANADASANGSANANNNANANENPNPNPNQENADNRQRLIIVQHRRPSNDDDNHNFARRISWEFHNTQANFDTVIRNIRRNASPSRAHFAIYISDRGLCSFGKFISISSTLSYKSNFVENVKNSIFPYFVVVNIPGMPRRNVQEGIVWIRADPRPADTLLERITVRNYRSVTDVTLRHLALCAPNLQYLDVTGTSITRKGIDTFLESRPDCQIISELLD